MQKQNYITAIKIALIIGTLLNLINSYDSVCYGPINTKLILKMLLTYCVPFGVSLYSSWKATKNN
jgi:hypothetical protein